MQYAIGVMTALLVGFGIGRWSMVTEPSAVLTLPKTPVSASVSTPMSACTCDECDVPEPDFAAELCQAQLGALRRRDLVVRQDWPEELGEETPDLWTERVEKAFASCSLPWTLEVVDCREFPCVAELALRPGELPPEQPSEEFEACSALDGLPEISVSTHTVRCLDGSTEDLHLAWSVDSDEDSDTVDAYLEALRVYGRRVDDMTDLHQCGT